MFVAGGLSPNSAVTPTQLSAAVIGALGFHILKIIPQIKGMNFSTTKLNHYLRLVVTFLTTVGIGWQWSSSVGGGHSLTIEIPAAMVLMLGVYHWATQYGYQWIGESIFEIITILKQSGTTPKPSA